MQILSEVILGHRGRFRISVRFLDVGSIRGYTCICCPDGRQVCGDPPDCGVMRGPDGQSVPVPDFVPMAWMRSALVIPDGLPDDLLAAFTDADLVQKTELAFCPAETPDLGRFLARELFSRPRLTGQDLGMSVYGLADHRYRVAKVLRSDQLWFTERCICCRDDREVCGDNPSCDDYPFFTVDRLARLSVWWRFAEDFDLHRNLPRLRDQFRLFEPGPVPVQKCGYAATSRYEPWDAMEPRNDPS